MKNPNESRDYKNQQSYHVINFNPSIDPEGKEFYNIENIKKSVETLTMNLISVLFQMINNKYDSLPDKELVLKADLKSTYNIEFQSSDEENYDKQLCSLTLKCLDFVYSYIDNIDGFMSVMIMYKIFHSVCNLWRLAIKRNCKIHEHYMCTNESILELYELLYFSYSNDINSKIKDYIVENMTLFIENYDRIDYENTRTMIQASTRHNIFEWKKNNDKGQIMTTKLKNKLNILDDENQKNLNNKLQSNNKTYLDELCNNNCNMQTLNSLKTNTTMDIPDTVYELMIYTLMIIEGEFEEVYIADYKRQINENITHIDIEVIENNMSSMFRDVCEYAPLSLFYLTQNNKTSDTSLFDLYILLCSNWSDFLYSRCHDISKTTNSLELNCVVHSIWNKLFLNYPSLINKTHHYDNAERCKSMGIDYIKNIFTQIHTFYKVQEYFAWTKLDWLSCKYFITENYSTSKSMDNIKNKIMPINNISMTFSEIYILVLPWNLNMNALLTLNNNVLSSLEYELEQYAYLHATMTNLYFQHTDNNVSDERLKLLSKTIHWYSNGLKVFYKYLLLSGTYISNNTTKPLIDAFKQISKTKTVSKIDNAILQSIKKKYKDWVVGQLPSIEGTGRISNIYLTHLNQLAVENCMNATEYINIFISITYKSILTTKNVHKNALKLSCFEFVSNVFIYDPRDDK